MQTYIVTYTPKTGKPKKWDVTAPGPTTARMVIAQMQRFKGSPSDYTAELVEDEDKPP